MPDFKKIVRDHLAQLGVAGGDEADLTEEISQHLEDRYSDLVAGGESEDAARRQALAEMESRYPIEGLRRLPKYEIPPAGHAPAGSFVEGLWKDLQYAMRGMRKSPLFVLFVVLTLAIGIGANTTVFTVINTLILNPLPVHKMDELVGVAATATQDTSRSKTFYPMSYLNLKDYESRNEVFTSLAGFADTRPATFEHEGALQGIFNSQSLPTSFRRWASGPRSDDSSAGTKTPRTARIRSRCLTTRHGSSALAPLRTL